MDNYQLKDQLIRKKAFRSPVIRYRSILFLILPLTMALSGCKMSYSFTGASVSPLVKTISIQYFANNAPLVNPTLSRTLTDALKNYFTSQTNLNLVDRNGDLIIEGTITGYSVMPTAIQGNETAAMNRLSVSISVKFTNKKNEKQDFDNAVFTRYQDYQSSKSLAAVEEELITEIVKQLVDDVFNKCFVNW